jgi:coatomer subunit gamma
MHLQKNINGSKVSSYHLLPIARDIVRRWQSETQEAASASKSSGGFSLGFSSGGNTTLAAGANYMQQYHAIGLLIQMRSHDSESTPSICAQCTNKF